MAPRDPATSRLATGLRGLANGTLRRLSCLVRTGNPAATLDRLFESQHVEDLRLIIAMALLGLGISAAPCLIYALEYAHKDLTEGRYLYFVLKSLANFVAYMGPLFAIFGAIVAWVYQVGSARLGVVDLFACEISTLCRVAVVIDTAHRNVELFERGPPVAPPGGAAAPAENPAAASQENYFPVFEGNTKDLQSLAARVVINITAFYTYMKVFRDMLRSRAAIRPGPQEVQATSGEPAATGPWHDAIRDLVFMLFLGLESARKAIHDLVEYQPEQTERMIVVLIGEIEAFRFLLGAFKPEDIRARRLQLRWEPYEHLIPSICRKVQDGLDAARRDKGEGDDETDEPGAESLAQLELQVWRAARELVPDLEQQFALTKAAVAKAAVAPMLAA
ncbi:MAG TPA: hypothetical protein VKS60_19835 [Stellaceae bacterium]|nr:hypothetical protein [Stellaceae bacterium]